VGAEACERGRDSAAGAHGDKRRRRTGFSADKESDRSATGEAGAWVAGLLGGKGIPCRQRRAGAGVTRYVWPRLAVAAACNEGRMKLATVWRRGLVATLETPTVEDAKGRRGAVNVDGLGVRGCGRGKEAEATHHLLRRYRRRLFLILAGPIWDLWLRHCCYCAVVEVEGSGQRGPGV
jgi:hypothetical protein